jgi:hypothetical protein
MSETPDALVADLKLWAASPRVPQKVQLLLLEAIGRLSTVSEIARGGERDHYHKGVSRANCSICQQAHPLVRWLLDCYEEREHPTYQDQRFLECAELIERLSPSSAAIATDTEAVVRKAVSDYTYVTPPHLRDSDVLADRIIAALKNAAPSSCDVSQKQDAGEPRSGAAPSQSSSTAESTDAARYRKLKELLDDEAVTAGLHEAFMAGPEAMDLALDAALGIHSATTRTPQEKT